MGCGSISQGTRDRIDVTLVDIAVVRERMAAILELLSASGYVFYFPFCGTIVTDWWLTIE
jgi:hypothetical protein